MYPFLILTEVMLDGWSAFAADNHTRTGTAPQL
jgi:hypothetical protein